MYKAFKAFYQAVFEIFYTLIRYSGMSFLFRVMLAKKKVSIVVYHNPSPENFEKHVKYLSKRYNFLTISDLSRALYEKSWHKLPEYPLLITIDDGWKENFHLTGITKKYNLRPTVFLTSHLVNTNRHFWWTASRNGYKKSDLKRMSNHLKLNKLLELSDFYPEKEFPGNRQVLNLDEIKEMKKFVDFGLHTCYHPVLTNCSYSEKLDEIVNCKKKVEEILGTNVEIFAYPNGDYDNECLEILKVSGIKICRTLEVGRNTMNSDPLKLKITGASDNGSLNKLASELTGIPLFFQHLVAGHYFKT